MPNTKDINFNDPFRLLVYGLIKTGKTELALTFPRPNVIDFDSGIKTARNPGFVKRHGLLDILFDQFPGKYDNRGVPMNFEAFDRACRYFDACMSPTTKMWTAYDEKQYPVNVDMFDTWVMDSGTTASNLASAKAIILLGGKETAKALGQSSGTIDAARTYGLIIPKLQDYGAERSMLEQFVQMLNDSGKMFVMVCHEKELRGKPDRPGEPGPIQAYVPLLTGQSVNTIPVMFDEVYNARTRPMGEGMNYYLQTVPDGLRQCGSRLGIPNEISNNWAAIKAALDEIRAAQSQQAAQAAGGTT